MARKGKSAKGTDSAAAAVPLLAESDDAGPAESADAAAKSETPAPPFPFAAPSRDLITAYLLLLLRNWNMHGYQLMQQLMLFGYQPTDPALYRQLRALERQGFIKSSWEAGDAGPARRTYTLTEAGNAFLSTWATAIDNYQKTLKFWSDLYTGMIAPPRH